MREKIEAIVKEATDAIASCQSEKELDSLEVTFLGRKSPLNELLKTLKDIDESQRRDIGPLANRAKTDIRGLFSDRRQYFLDSAFDADAEWIDVTAPGKSRPIGHANPITIVRRDIEKIFTTMGFEVADGPEVETEWNNFDALNIPKDHPARDAWDTFWLNEKAGIGETEQRLALRPHTSPVQIRYMMSHTPPFRIIVPGKCFRNESTDATHEHTFYQFEALLVGDGISVAHFKSVGEEFFSRFFGKKIVVRLRPSFFPFTEPSFEFDISCTMCGGAKCQACKRTGWLEVGGAGMVNQAVFESVGYGRGNYSGFAWGFGLERLAMMKYKIDDVRLFHGGDIRFIRQFSS